MSAPIPTPTASSPSVKPDAPAATHASSSTQTPTTTISSPSPAQPSHSPHPQPTPSALPLPFPVYTPHPHPHPPNPAPTFHPSPQYPPYSYSQYPPPPFYSIPHWPSTLHPPPPPPYYSWTPPPPHHPSPPPPPPSHPLPSQPSPRPRPKHTPEPPSRPPRHPSPYRHPSPNSRRNHHPPTSPRPSSHTTTSSDHDPTPPTPSPHSTPRRAHRRKHSPSQPSHSSPTHSQSLPSHSPPVPSPHKPPRDPTPDLDLAISELDRAACKAVQGADDVTLALLLTNWKNNLEEAYHIDREPTGAPTGGVKEFERVFHASSALDIVVVDVLLRRHVAPGVRKAMLGLAALVLYGDDQLGTQLFAEVEMLGEGEGHADAVRNVLTVLKELRRDVRAYEDVLPGQKTLTGKQSGGSGGPAGPDPTKAVERSMDGWRRAMGRLQGELAILGVLKTGRELVQREFRGAGEMGMVGGFFTRVAERVKECLDRDVAKRKKRLDGVFWRDATSGADGTVFQAAKERAAVWLRQFEAARGEVESRLYDAGIGFGPSGRVAVEKVDVLVAASAGVAGLVSCQQYGFVWAKDVGELLRGMVRAFWAVEKLGGREFGPPTELKERFLGGIEETFDAVEEVVNWTFTGLSEKVLGSLEKSSGMEENGGVGNTMPQKSRSLRFEEPEKSHGAGGEDKDVGKVRMAASGGNDDGDESGLGGGGGGGNVSAGGTGGRGNGQGGQGRIKPRHARMKSSPDALLHLNTHLDDEDDYGMTETEVDRELDREIETSDGAGAVTVKGLGAKLVVENGRCGLAEGGARGEELQAVPEGGILEFEDDGEEEFDPDDDEIIVHEDVEEEEEERPKKVAHSSHVRSMSVDGIPF